MKKIIFYVEPEWAFGSVHYELSKYLKPYDIDCQILPWNKSYTIEEIYELVKVTDLFVTTPHGWRILGYGYNVVPAEKCVIISHARSDILELIKYNLIEDYKKFYRYSCVSEWLRSISRDLKIPRDPDITPIGINYNSFFSEPNEKLTTLGYAGFYSDRSEVLYDYNNDLPLPRYHKRSYLVKEIAEKLGLKYKIAHYYHSTYITMPGFYRNVDCVIIPSTEEGAGLPALEAGAAGKLVIGTAVGHWNQKIQDFGGIEVPIPEQEFVEKTSEILSYYIAHPKEYRDRCYQIREHAKTYDWSHVVKYWVDLLK